MRDGIIELDSPFARQLGFTSEKFDGYLWKEGKYIYNSFIISRKRGKGNLRQLFNRIRELGYGIKVPTPLGVMRVIVEKYGFRRTVEFFRIADRIEEPVEVWVKEASE